MTSTPDEFNCPITHDIMDDPVLCEDGYTYERSAIMNQTITLSPMTRQPLDKTKIFPNRALKNAIDRFTAYSNDAYSNDAYSNDAYSNDPVQNHETFTYDNCSFKFKIDTSEIKITMTDNTSMEIYEGVIKETDINSKSIKSIKKIYSMIIKALNKEPGFNFSINNENPTTVGWFICFNNDVVDMKEYIILTKISVGETTETSSLNKLKDLLTPVFG